MFRCRVNWVGMSKFCSIVTLSITVIVGVRSNVHAEEGADKSQVSCVNQLENCRVSSVNECSICRLNANDERAACFEINSLMKDDSHCDSDYESNIEFCDLVKDYRVEQCNEQYEVCIENTPPDALEEPAKEDDSVSSEEQEQEDEEDFAAEEEISEE